MTLTKTPICDFGKKAEDFKLQSINNKSVSLEEIKGKNGTLIMFICNHCPYVKAVIKDLVEDCKDLKNEGINSVAIMSNDTKNYPEDSFDKMIEFAKDNQFDDLNYRTTNQLKLNKIKLKKFNMWLDDANALLSAFINSIDDKKNILKINKDHLNSLAIVDACIRSSKSGKKISIKNY